MKKRGLCWNKTTPTLICQPPKGTLKNEQKNHVCASNGVTYANYNTVACLRIYNYGETELTFIYLRYSLLETHYNYTFCLQFMLLFFSGLRILHDGPCNYKDIVFPKDMRQTCYLADNHVITMPVCGSNNVTYPNPFVLKCAQHRGIVSSGTSRICYAVLHVYRMFMLNTVFHHLISMLLTSITNRA